MAFGIQHKERKDKRKMCGSINILRDSVYENKIKPDKFYEKIMSVCETYYLCCPHCQSEFENDPTKFINNLKSERS